MPNWKIFHRFILPFTCLLCKTLTSDQLICEPCRHDLPFIKIACPVCGRSSTHNLTCGICLTSQPSYDATVVLFSYLKPVTHLILNLKFNHRLENANLLGHLLAEKILHTYKILPDMIIPIPLHKERLKQRGFNQANEIAKPLQKILNIPIQHACIRTKNTPAQATLEAEFRKKNLRDAFLVTQDVKGKYIAVVDDVITTGHTVIEFCRTLKRAGAKKIDVWCCAAPLS